MIPLDVIDSFRTIFLSLNVNAAAVVSLPAPPLAEFGAALLHFDSFTTAIPISSSSVSSSSALKHGTFILTGKCQLPPSPAA